MFVGAVWQCERKAEEQQNERGEKSGTENKKEREPECGYDGWIARDEGR